MAPANPAKIRATIQTVSFEFKAKASVEVIAKTTPNLNKSTF